MITVVWILVYILIGVITALTLSWKRITCDHIDMIIVTYGWPVFLIYFIGEKVFYKWPCNLYKKWNKKMGRRGK